MITKDEVIAAFGNLSQTCPNPDDLPDTDDVTAACELYWQWVNEQEDYITTYKTQEDYERWNFEINIFFIEIGFTDPNYLREVVEEFLDQDLDRVRALGFTQLASEIEAKIEELKALLVNN